MLEASGVDILKTKTTQSLSTPSEQTFDDFDEIVRKVAINPFPK